MEQNRRLCAWKMRFYLKMSYPFLDFLAVFEKQKPHFRIGLLKHRAFGGLRKASGKIDSPPKRKITVIYYFFDFNYINDIEFY